jgi:hypothetical protein
MSSSRPIRLTVYSPEPGSPGRAALDLLASWAAIGH